MEMCFHIQANASIGVLFAPVCVADWPWLLLYLSCVCEKVFYVFLRTQKLPKVNKELALKLMEEGDEEEGLASRKKKGKVGESSLSSFCWASQYKVGHEDTFVCLAASQSIGGLYKLIMTPNALSYT